MLDLALYESAEYKRELHRAVRESLRTLAQVRPIACSPFAPLVDSHALSVRHARCTVS